MASRERSGASGAGLSRTERARRARAGDSGAESDARVRDSGAASEARARERLVPKGPLAPETVARARGRSRGIGEALRPAARAGGTASPPQLRAGGPRRGVATDWRRAAGPTARCRHGLATGGRADGEVSPRLGDGRQGRQGQARMYVATAWRRAAGPTAKIRRAPVDFAQPLCAKSTYPERRLPKRCRLPGRDGPPEVLAPTEMSSMLSAVAFRRSERAQRASLWLPYL